MGRPRTAASVLLLLGFVAAVPALAQVVDTTLFSTDAPVRAVARDGNTIYIGGQFQVVGTATGGAVPIDPATAAIVQPYPRANGGVNSIVGDGAGGWYVGGDFTSIGGRPLQGLAHVFADGSVDPWDARLHSDFAAMPAVNSLALSGGILYVAGYFTQAGDSARSRLVAFDVTTGRVTKWDPDANEIVNVLAAGAGAIYVGGDFTAVGGQARNRVAALDPVTGAATAWDAHIPAYDGSFGLGVNALAVSGNLLYVGGTFNVIGGQTRRCIAALRTSDGTAASWNPDAGDPVTNGVTALAVDGGTVYAGGVFTAIGGKARNDLAALSAATGAASSWNPAPDHQVTCLAVRGGLVYAGGVFRNIGGAARSRLAALDAVTGVATAWNPGPNSTVLAIDVSGASIYAGGAFRFVGATTRRRLAAFDAVTHQLLDWDPDADNYVSALAVRGGTVYAGGAFANIGGMARSRVAAIDAVTGVPTAWAPVVSDLVDALAPGGDTLYVGGSFTNMDGQMRNRLAAFDVTTGSLLPWNPNVAGGSVDALAVAGGSVYVGGSFASIGGVPGRAYLAAADAATGAVQPWNPHADGAVLALAIAGNVLYAGGNFTQLAGQALRIGAVDLATAQATAFHPAYDCGSIQGLAIGSGVVYAGGGCSTIAAFSAATGATLPWTLEGPYVSTMFLDGATLYIGGSLALPVGNSIQGGLVAVSAIDATVPVLADFHARRTDEGVRLEWRLGVPGRVAGVEVQRADAVVGPWRDVAITPVVADGLASAVDTDAAAGALWYRLSLHLGDGSTARLGPVGVAAAAAAARAGLAAVSPNPSAGLVRVDLVATRRERVRVSVVDIAGREVDVLHEGDLEAGTHVLLWEPRARAPLAAGVYFVRWRSASRTEQRTIVLAR